MSEVKWLGKDAVGCFALDGREKKADVIQGVRRWVAARGRNVTLPGMDFGAFVGHAEISRSDDCLIRDATDA